MLKWLMFSWLFVATTLTAAPLQVVASVPDLGSLAREIGGDRIDLLVLAKATEDPHFVDAKPSFIRRLNQADLFLETGMELEVGWVPPLLRNARNSKILPGQPGHLDASQAVEPLGGHPQGVNRAMGDVHPSGNPHYLLDPVNGLAVAALIRDRLSQLRPQEQAYFHDRYDAFSQRLAHAMLGELASHYAAADIPKLATLYARGELGNFLRQQGQVELLGGWFARMQPYQDSQLVDDHEMWLYLAHRFRLNVAGHMEPKPGVLPTTTHLQALVELMRRDQIKLIITSTYYDPKHARFLSQATGAKVATLAHQAGAAPGTESYVDWLDYNVGAIADAFSRP